MSEHLPECAPRITNWGEDCICQYLRACEQRVADEIWGAIQEGSQYKSGFEGGLDAAREAVAAIRHAPDCRALCPCCMGDYDCNCERYEALAAIDALLAKPDNQRVSENPDD